MTSESSHAAPAGQEERWYVKTSDGSIYGPASFVDLMLWASEARIVPGCAVSENAETWIPAEKIPELKMEWDVELTNGVTIGPLHLLAICDLVRDGAVQRGASVSQHATREKTTVDDAFLTLVAQQARDMLAATAAALAQQTRERPVSAPAPEPVPSASAPAGTAPSESARADLTAQLTQAQNVLAAKERGWSDRMAAAEQKHASDASAWTERLSAAQKESAEAQNAAATAQRELASAQQDNECLRTALEKEQQAHNATQLQNASATEELQARINALEKEAAGRVELQARLAKIEADYREATAHAEQLNRTLVDERQAQTAVQQSLQAEKTSLAGKLDEAQNANLAQQQRLNELQQALEKAVAQQRAAMEERQAHETRWNAQVAALETSVAGLCAQLEERRRELTQSQAELLRQQTASTEATATWQREKAELLEQQRQRIIAHQAELQKTQEMLERQLTEWQTRLAQQEEEWRKRLRSVEESLKQETDRREAEWQQKLTTAETDAQQRQSALQADAQKTQQRLAETQEQLTAERKERDAERKKTQLTEWELRAEIVRVQRECGVAAGVLEKARVALDVKAKPAGKKIKPEINWMAGGQSKGADGELLGAEESTLLLRIECLQEEARVAKALYDRSEKELAQQMELNRTLQTEHASREEEFNASLAQLRREAESADQITRQTMQEIERREGEWRTARRKAEEREQQLAARLGELERQLAETAMAAARHTEPAQVVKPEVMPPESATAGAGQRSRGAPPGATADSKAAGKSVHPVLAGLEAQAQVELKEWRQGKTNSGAPSSKLQKWLRIKKT
jgi:myosin heavy subunit